MPLSYLDQLFGLRDHVAVVIGGTGVLGGAFCEGLAKAGGRVIVAGRNQQRGEERATAIQQQGGAAEFCTVDSTRRESLEGLLSTVIAKHGRVDVLVNCAGVNAGSSYLQANDDDWQRILGVNLTSVHQACQIFGEQMVKRKSGAIINIGSVTSHKPLSRVFAYSASKAAVLNLTQNIAREFGPHNVRVNCLCPGFFPAEQNRAILDAERKANIMQHTPLGRFGEPDELIGALLLLASPNAGKFITGAAFYIDGGFTATSI